MQADIQGKTIILTIVEEDVRDGIATALQGLPVYLQQVDSAQDAFNFLEDYPVHLLITAPQLPDMHSLQLIYKLKETYGLRNLPIAIIADTTNHTHPMPNVEYLIRPLSITQIRQRVCQLLP